VEAAPSDAEARVDEQPAQVGAANRLLVGSQRTWRRRTPSGVGSAVRRLSPPAASRSSEGNVWSFQRQRKRVPDCNDSRRSSPGLAAVGFLPPAEQVARSRCPDRQSHNSPNSLSETPGRFKTISSEMTS
jgi:hypothetical protein